MAAKTLVKVHCMEKKIHTNNILLTLLNKSSLV